MLTVHRAERADPLVDGLAELLAVPAADPFETELVCVPTRGVERWISQRLSHRLGAASADDGVCANVAFPSPAELVARTVERCSGIADGESGWAPPRLRWAVLRAVDEAIATDDSAYDLLATYVGRRRATHTSPHESARRLAAADRVTALFTSYAAQRPAMVEAWAAGEDEDGAGSTLPNDLKWQPALWREIRRLIGAPSPAEALPGILHQLRTDPTPSALPQRLSVFGPTRLTQSELEVLVALAVRHDVHLWLPHPSPTLWDEVARVLSDADHVRSRAEDPTADCARLPLLASLGRDARELQVRLATAARDLPWSDTHHPMPTAPSTVLGRLQRSIGQDAAPPSSPGPRDASVQFHACHGLVRQVEVLRELVLGMLSDDPTLEPRDVVVMCPDIAAAAPLVTAAFGPGIGSGGHPAHQIRLRVADQSLVVTNPLMAVLAHLLSLADAKLTAEDVLGLAQREPVARHFELGEDDIQRLAQLVLDAQTRWGLDADHRQRMGLPPFEVATWEWALNRLALGAAVSADGLPLVGGVLPVDDVSSGDVRLIGRLTSMISALRETLAAMREEQTLSRWVDSLSAALARLTAPDPRNEWQTDAVEQLLGSLAASAQHPDQVVLSPVEIRDVLADDMAGRPSRTGFRTGDLTVCSLAPMRSVPHRVVCLLGMDDDAFPRRGAASADDVLARRPFVGDRDARSEDRQILLDAVHAATDRLIVLFTGMDPRTNAEVVPAVPVEQLLDALTELCVPDASSMSPEDARRHLVVRHPAHPYDEAALSVTGDLAHLISTERPFSFDASMAAAASAARSPRSPRQPLSELRLPPHTQDHIDIGDLVDVLANPSRAFLRQRLGVVVRRDDSAVAESSLVTPLDPLSRWAIGDRLLRLKRRGMAGAVEAAELARGQLPPGEHGRAELERIVAQVEAVARLAPPMGQSIPVHAALADGRAVVGAVPDTQGELTSVVTFSTVKPQHELEAWVRLLALSLTYPTDGWRSQSVGRAGRSGASVAAFEPLPVADARAMLEALASLFDQGMQAVLPIPARTARAYVVVAKGRADTHTVDRAAAAAERAWSERHGDREDAANTQVWGSSAPLEALLRAPAPISRSSAHPTWFADAAHHVWWPLIQARSRG